MSELEKRWEEYGKFVEDYTMINDLDWAMLGFASEVLELNSADASLVDELSDVLWFARKLHTLCVVPQTALMKGQVGSVTEELARLTSTAKTIISSYEKMKRFSAQFDKLAQLRSVITVAVSELLEDIVYLYAAIYHTEVDDKILLDLMDYNIKKLKERHYETTRINEDRTV